MNALTIDGEKQELNFGVKFVRELDKVAGISANNVSFGFGLTKTLPAIKAYDPAVLSDLIYSATFKNGSARPSRDAVDDYVDSITDVEELEKLFDDVTAEINKATAIKAALKNMKA